MDVFGTIPGAILLSSLIFTGIAFAYFGLMFLFLFIIFFPIFVFDCIKKIVVFIYKFIRYKILKKEPNKEDTQDNINEFDSYWENNKNEDESENKIDINDIKIYL